MLKHVETVILKLVLSGDLMRIDEREAKKHQKSIRVP